MDHRGVLFGRVEKTERNLSASFIYCVSEGDEMAERINSSMSSDFLCEWRG
jgi:hypothetical protein